MPLSSDNARSSQTTLFVYPVWLVSLLVVLVLYALVVAVLWVLFLPLRLYMRAAHKGSYARPEGQG